MIIALHLVVEDLGLTGVGAGDQVLVQHLEDVVANVVQLRLNLGPVALDHLDLVISSLQVEKCKTFEFYSYLTGFSL